MSEVDRYEFANKHFGPLGEEDGFCDYCNSVHDLLDFGSDLNGDKTLICSNLLSDITAQPADDYDILEANVLDGEQQ